METVRIRDGKKSDPGPGINIPDSQHWAKSVLKAELYFLKKLQNTLQIIENYDTFDKTENRIRIYIGSKWKVGS
jgi:hypothetical protein